MADGLGPRPPGYRLRPAACFAPLLPLYDPLCRLLGFGPRFRRAILDALDLEERHRLLDVGGATGVLAGAVRRAFPSATVVLVDPDRAALRRAARRIGSPSVAVALGEALPLRSGVFDRAVSSLALHHVPDPWRLALLHEVHRVLCPDGRFLLVDFDNRGRRWVPRRFRSSRGLGDWLAAAGFRPRPLGVRRGVEFWAAEKERGAGVSSGVSPRAGRAAG